MIRVEVGCPSAGFDLRESLARRGIQSVLVEAAGGWEIEIASPREEPERLFHDVAEGVESWLAGRGGAGLVVWVGPERPTIEHAGGLGGIVARPEVSRIGQRPISGRPLKPAPPVSALRPISAEEAPQAPVTA